MKPISIYLTALAAALTLTAPAAHAQTAPATNANAAMLARLPASVTEKFTYLGLSDDQKMQVLKYARQSDMNTGFPVQLLTPAQRTKYDARYGPNAKVVSTPTAGLAPISPTTPGVAPTLTPAPASRPAAAPK